MVKMVKWVRIVKVAENFDFQVFSFIRSISFVRGIYLFHVVPKDAFVWFWLQI